MTPTATPEPIATTWRSYIAELPAWGIVLGALAVSFWTQVDQVHRHGFAMWEALIWGTSTDAGTIACLFLAREGAHRGTPTWGAWLLSLACAFLSVQYNVVAGIDAGDWLAVEAHVWMPALALGVWFWLLHGRHRRWMLPWPDRQRDRGIADEPGSGADAGRRPAHQPPPDMIARDAAAEEPESEPDRDPNRIARVPARAEVRRLLKRHGAALTARRVSLRTGVSIQHARKLLREERSPRVVREGDGSPGEQRREREAE